MTDYVPLRLTNVRSRVRIYLSCGHNRLTDGIHHFADIHNLVGKNRYCLVCNGYSLVYNAIPEEMPILVTETSQDAHATPEPSVTTRDQ